jgi:hypothetical protein
MVTCESCGNNVSIKDEFLKQILRDYDVPDKYHEALASFIDEDMPGFLKQEAEIFKKSYILAKKQGKLDESD